ncbi:MAG: hypothetical protein K2P69_09970, partial [Eubacterium sp.]|nr:hypothetical protein [Eubacterium sp.]
HIRYNDFSEKLIGKAISDKLLEKTNQISEIRNKEQSDKIKRSCISQLLFFGTDIARKWL